MVRKTRKHGKHGKHGKPSLSGINSIPELRRSFEYIEDFVDKKLHHESKAHICKELRKEWRRVFMKELNKKSAEAFIEDRLLHKGKHSDSKHSDSKHSDSKHSDSKHSDSKHRTIRRKGGAVLAGAPLEYATRAGNYLAPGQVPQAGHLPLSQGGESNYGYFNKYIDAGFVNPTPGKLYDPVEGQASPIVPYAATGSNQVMKGGKRVTRGSRKLRRSKKRGGGLLNGMMDSTGAFLNQAFTRPIFSSSPAGILQDGQDIWHGKPVGMSPDQVQRSPSYSLGPIYPKAISINPAII